MDDRTHHHHTHTHGGRTHVHASVDHLANELGNSTRLAIRLDSTLMAKLGVEADAIVRVATNRGRSILARLDAPFEGDAGTGVIRLDRFVRQALKAHLNESVEVETAEIGTAKRIELNPAVDVTMAHDLVPHIKKYLAASRMPAPPTRFRTSRTARASSRRPLRSSSTITTAICRKAPSMSRSRTSVAST